MRNIEICTQKCKNTKIKCGTKWNRWEELITKVGLYTWRNPFILNPADINLCCSSNLIFGWNRIQNISYEIQTGICELVLPESHSGKQKKLCFVQFGKWLFTYLMQVGRLKLRDVNWRKPTGPIASKHLLNKTL